MPKHVERVGFLGGGTIAFAIGSALISQGIIKSCHIHASGPSLKNLERWRHIGANVTEKNGVVVTKCDIIFICVKPHVMLQCAQQVEGNIEPNVCDSNKLFVSVLTGTDLDQLELAFSFMTKLKLIRLTPNTPVQVAKGCAVYTPGRYITEQDLDRLKLLLGPLSILQQVPEHMMNALTALNACGTAYVYVVLNALADGLIALGVPLRLALRIAAQTMIGSAKMVLETGKHPAILRDECIWPGESAIVGYHELEKVGIRNGFFNAIETATKINWELGETSRMK